MASTRPARHGEKSDPVWPTTSPPSNSATLSTKQQAQVEPELKAIFYQDSLEQADQMAAAFIEKYQALYPTAVARLNRDLVTA